MATHAACAGGRPRNGLIGVAGDRTVPTPSLPPLPRQRGASLRRSDRWPKEDERADNTTRNK